MASSRLWDGRLAMKSYVLEGSAFYYSRSMAEDGLGLIKSAPEIEALAQTVSDDGVYFVPALTGLVPPIGTLMRVASYGIDTGTTAAIGAHPRGYAFQNFDILGEAGRLRPTTRQLKSGWRQPPTGFDAVPGRLTGVELVRPKDRTKF